MSVRLEIRVSHELKSRLEEKARELGISLSDLVRDALQLYVALARNGIPIELIKEAMKNPSEEKFLLKVGRWKRYDSFVDEGDFKIIYGEADAVELSCYFDDTRHDCDYIIVPRSIPVVVDIKTDDATTDPEVHREEVCIFTKDGWKCVEVR